MLDGLQPEALSMTMRPDSERASEAAELIARMDAHIAGTEHHIAKARALLADDALDGPAAALAESTLADLEAGLERIRDSRRQLVALFSQ